MDEKQLFDTPDLGMPQEPNWQNSQTAQEDLYVPHFAPVAAPTSLDPRENSPVFAAIVPPRDTCASCGTPLGDSAFCPLCGTPRHAVPVGEKPAPFVKACSGCGTSIRAGQHACPRCGRSAYDAPQRNPVRDAAAEEALREFDAAMDGGKKNVVLPIVLGSVMVLLTIVLLVFLRAPDVENIYLHNDVLRMEVGDAMTLDFDIVPADASRKRLKWKSSNSSVARVSDTGYVQAISEGTCTITLYSGGVSDSVVISVTDLPSFSSLYYQYCNSSWAEYGTTYLKIDTNPYNFDDDGLYYIAAYYAIEDVNEALGLPASLFDRMGETRGIDGTQSYSYDGIYVTWSYHPDRGLEVTYRAN